MKQVYGSNAVTVCKTQYFEWARAFGALAIVLLHVFASVLDNYDVIVIGTAKALVYSEIQIVLTRWAVPVFLMISGALILNKEKALSFDKIRTYIWRMVCILLTFGLAYCLIEAVSNERSFQLWVIGEAVLNLLQGNSWSHMWYVYALIGLYILTPPLKAFVLNSTKHELTVSLSVLFAIASIVPTINAAGNLELTTFVELPVYLFYYLFGYYASTYLMLTLRSTLLGVSALVVLMLVTAFSIVFNSEYLNWMRSATSCFVAVYSAVVFLSFKRFAQIPIESHPFFSLMAKYSFGIYVIHPLFLNCIFKLPGSKFAWEMIPVIGELLVYVVVLVGSIVSVWLLKKLPGFRAWL